MKTETIFEIKALYRDNFRVQGFSFGEGEQAVCIVGSMRGNENQQLYACSQLLRALRELEERGQLVEGRRILVVPCVNPYSMNVKKRFWSIDNTDINRMFPGYALGETTQRIAAGVFEQIRGYRFGIQFASFYMPGSFVPHIRMMATGYENVSLAAQFGLPYIVLHQPRPFDTTTLNYNWQIWETNAFSIYTTNTARIDRYSAQEAVHAILHFLSEQGIICGRKYYGHISRIVKSEDFLSLRAERAGFFQPFVRPGEQVVEGQRLAVISDPLLGEPLSTITAPADGVAAFVQDEPMCYQHTAVIKLIGEEQP